MQLRRASADDDTLVFNNLNALINQLNSFRQFFFDKNLNSFPDIVPNLSNDRKLVMNPYSHDDIETPLFRRELKLAIEDVERLSNVIKKPIIADDEVGSKEFKMNITNGAETIEAVFVFVERFERIEYSSIRYYGASKISVKSITSVGINTSSSGYNVRKLFKDIYEKLNLTAATRPVFEDVITIKNDGTLLSAL